MWTWIISLGVSNGVMYKLDSIFVA